MADRPVGPKPPVARPIAADRSAWESSSRTPAPQVHAPIFDATVEVRRLMFLPVVRPGRRHWSFSHIPGSDYASIPALSDQHASKVSMAMPAAEWFAAGIGELGVGDDSRVVLYDRRENMWAARLWWMLRSFGFDDAAVLDGGWTAWREGEYLVSAGPCHYRPATFTATPRPRLLADKDEVLAAIGDPGVCLVNALGRRQHRGEVNEYGRRGHIPGSRNVTAWEILDRRTQRYRPLPELRAKVCDILDAERVITYCGGGVAASSVAHVLVRLGHPNVAVNMGGMLEWCRDRSLPLETGA